ncbi:unnamed protein product [Rotaria magnacalcarata]|uniref:Uncharacterized protein n=1 Tax=Rotaria magnacalcarata TaxID=392030 RepID=A0A816X8S6_9BILA|nr:unnamed protein product [Rotaria magnacalcarata]CAF1499211.1 unnamed protein product [Rotaria magnacalcarata]CAF2144001.1 unnamed protein product [Rotaria magnacalcarata]CAF4050724.1 unnamed protein product [Rotaria magnacalcarata]CAF4068047.1 unnamed protein product [Rotaria magnacalcarata]
MSIITDIVFNNTIYSPYDDWGLLLHQKSGPSSLITVPSAELITFMKNFNDLTGCQNHIQTNSDKNITLFVDDGNMQTWLLNDSVEVNVDDINIFCRNIYDKEYFKRWKRRQERRIRNIITYDELNRELLLFGMKLIKELCVYFKDDHGILNLLEEDYERIRLALINSLSP